MKSKKNNFNQLSDWENQPSKEKIRRKKKKKAYAKDVDERRQFIIYLLIKKYIMKYAQQTQNALDRLDQSLATLRTLIKRGQNADALRFMEEGDLKEKFGELQNIITISSTGNIGARGVQNTGTF